MAFPELLADELAPLKQRYEAGARPKDLALELGCTALDVDRFARKNGWVKPSLVYDEEAVRRDYEADVLTRSEIASKHSIPLTDLHNLISRRGWSRPLGRRIKQAAEKKIQDEVAKQVDEKRGEFIEEAIVEANAMVQAAITKHHRSGASTAREAAVKLLAEMSALAISQEQLNQFIEVAALQQSQGVDDFDVQERVRREAVETFRKLTGLGSRSNTLKNLVGALSQAVDLERKVYGIREEVVENDVTKALRELASDV